MLDVSDGPMVIVLMKTAKVYPLHPPEGSTETGWADLSHEFDFSPFPLEHDLGYWEVLHDLIESEPPYESYRNEDGELAALGIAKGRSFDPDERMRDILVRAARSQTRRCACSRSLTDGPTGRFGRARTGSGQCCVPRTARSTLRAMSISTRARNGSSRRRSSRRRCSPAPRVRARSTGSARVMAAAHIWTAVTPIGSVSRCRCRTSCSGQSPCMTPRPRGDRHRRELGRAPLLGRTARRQARGRGQRRPLLRARAARRLLGDADSVDLYFGPEQPDGADGRWIKTLPDRAGSSISVSTDLTRTRSTEPGDSQTSNSSTDPTAPTSDIGSHCWTVA